MSDQLDIYKMAVEMADRVSSRRMAANGFFLTLETTLFTVIGFFYPKVAASEQRWALVIVSAIGIVLALTWFLAIRSYRRLNKAKFAVINKIEAQLPIQYFTEEWNELKGTGNNVVEPHGVRERWLRVRDRYTDLTTIETFVPAVFGVVYLAVLIGIAFKVTV